MGTDNRLFEEELNRIEPRQPAYPGRTGQTHLESVHWTTPDHQITSVRVHTVVNATTDPGLADRLCSGTLNWIRLPESEELHPVSLPVVYHNEALRLFVLMLPPDYRTRELQERAALLSRLAEDQASPVPLYVLNFYVVFGNEELRHLVESASTPHVELTPIRPLPPGYMLKEETRPRQILPTTAEPPDPVPARPRRRRKDAKASAEPQKRPVEPSAEEPRAETTSDDMSYARAVLKAEAEAILQEMDDIEGWSDEPDGKSKPSLEADEPALYQESPQEPVVEEQTEQVERYGENPAPAASVPSEFNEVDSKDIEEIGEIEEIEEIPTSRQVEALPEALASWRDSDETHALYMEDGLIHAAVRLSTSRIDPFVGVDPIILLQLHRTPTYPLAVMAIFPPDDEDSVVFWPMDILDEVHLTVLETLGRDFRFQVDLYDIENNLVVSRQLHSPLEENARLLRRKATEHLTALGDTDPDLSAAVVLWESPGFERLAVKEHAFSQRSFDDLKTPSATETALKIVSWWTEEDREDYLLLIASFPVVWWRKIRTRVVKKAMELGLWLPEKLLLWTLNEGHATSRKDLLRHCAASFVQVVNNKTLNDLDATEEHENWLKLLDESNQSGMPLEPEAEQLLKQAELRLKNGEEETNEVSRAPAAEMHDADTSLNISEHLPEEGMDVAPVEEIPVDQTPDELATLSTDSLMEQLQDKNKRLQAAIYLCRRLDQQTLESLFGALRIMTRNEVVRVLPHLLSFGEQIEEYLIQDLHSKKSFLRQGAALALGVLKSEKAIEPMVECLLSEPSGIWREVARGLGEIGSGSIMTLAAAIRSADQEERERIACALSYVAAGAEPKNPLQMLASSQDPLAAAVAQRALELMDEVRNQQFDTSSAVDAFSREFFEGLEGRDRELGDGDIVDSQPLQEEMDQDHEI